MLIVLGKLGQRKSLEQIIKKKIRKKITKRRTLGSVLYLKEEGEGEYSIMFEVEI
jgi:hypothetical protein